MPSSFRARSRCRARRWSPPEPSAIGGARRAVRSPFPRCSIQPIAHGESAGLPFDARISLLLRTRRDARVRCVRPGGRTVTYKQDRTESPRSRDGVGLRVAPPFVPAFADARQPGPAGQTGKCTDSDRRGQVRKNPPRSRSGVPLPRKPADVPTAASALRTDARPPVLVSGTIRRRACGVSQGRSSGARAGCHRLWSACPHTRAMAY